MKTGKQADNGPAATPAAPWHRWSSRVPVLLAGVLILGLGVALWRQPKRAGESPAAGRSASQRTYGNPGPWGALEYVPIIIEPPDEFFSVAEQMNYELTWVFQRHSPAQVRQLFLAAGLPAATATWLLNERNWRVFPDGVVIVPPLEVMLALPRPAREKIYGVLAECGGNSLQELPVSRSLGAVDQWFSASQLSPATIALSKSVLYQRGNSWCFSDWPAVLRTLPSPVERRRFIKTILRQETLFGRLRVRPGTDVDQLVAYWGRGGRSKDIRSVLESLAMVEGGASVDIVHLLPRFVRARAYTFPFPSDSPITPSCYWTSMNFFAHDEPDDRFHDPDYMRRALAEDYVQVSRDYQLGDVLVLAKPDGTFVHVASYVADDVVFTKNGAHHIQPWIFSKLEEVVSGYPSVIPLKVLAFRRKPI